MREDWIEAKIGEILLIERGGSPRPIKEFITKQPSGINWIKIGDTLKGSKYITSTEEKIKVEGLKKTRIVEPGDFVLSNSMSFGRPFIMGIKGAIHDGWLALRNPNSIFDTDFLYYSLSSPNVYSQFDKLATGSTVRNLNSELVAKVIVSIPPFPEQRAIAKKLESLFSSLDAGVADLKKAQQQLKIYRQAVLKKAFEGELTNNKKVEYVHLGELCDGVEYGTSAKSNEKGEIPVLRMGNIQNGLFDWKNLVYTDDKSEIDKYLLEKYDVLFNRTNSAELVGKTAIYKGERPAIFAGYLIRINYKKDVLDPFYLCYYLNSHEAKNYGSSVKSFGVNQSNINGTKLKAYPIPFTPFEEQKKIVKQIESRLSVCDSIEQNIKESLVKAEALRQSILKIAFKGNLLTVQELAECKLAEDYEPASVLLERIKKENKKK